MYDRLIYHLTAQGLGHSRPVTPAMKEVTKLTRLYTLILPDFHTFFFNGLGYINTGMRHIFSLYLVTILSVDS